MRASNLSNYLLEARSTYVNDLAWRLNQQVFLRLLTKAKKRTSDLVTKVNKNVEAFFARKLASLKVLASISDSGIGNQDVTSEEFYREWHFLISRA